MTWELTLKNMKMMAVTMPIFILQDPKSRIFETKFQYSFKDKFMKGMIKRSPLVCTRQTPLVVCY